MTQPPPPSPGGPYQPQSAWTPPPVNPWPPPGPPPKQGNGWKWALGAVALLAVVGVTVAVTLSVSGNSLSDSQVSDSKSLPPASDSDSTGIASADDTGPISLITEDPSCAPVRPILETRAAVQRNGWNERDASIPATEWTPEMRAQFDAVGESMRASAEQLVPIAKLTPHRVMRQLYEQLIAYSTAYADALPTYTAADDILAVVSATTGNAISNICGAIDYGSAAARAPLVEPVSGALDPAPVRAPSEARPFLSEVNPVCEDWMAAISRFQRDIKDWAATSPNIPAGEWSPEQRSLNEKVAPVMRRIASEMQALGSRSGNSTLQDFADLAALYRNAYVEALPTYTPADKYLSSASLLVSGVVDAACEAAGT